MARSGSLIGFVVLASAQALGAAAPPQPGGAGPGRAQHVTLDEALRAAEQSSPLIRRARAEREAVAAREVGASLVMPSNPIVVGGAGPGARGRPRTWLTSAACNISRTSNRPWRWAGSAGRGARW